MEQNNTILDGCIAERLTELFLQLDPSKMGSEFAVALAAGDTEKLIRITADYFRSRPERQYCRTILKSRSCSRETADRAADGAVTVINIPWQFSTGEIDWFFNPTRKTESVDYEWQWQLNRMSFWMDMCAAYLETGDRKYAAAFHAQVRRWIETAGFAPDDGSWNAAGSVWRTIEAGLRMMYSWPLAFETFRKSAEFEAETLCLMLHSLYRHGLHLQAHHRKNSNWLLMEMSGLYTFGVLFPEFRCSEDMRLYAADVFSQAIMEQILPDGMHSELSPDYHSVMCACSLVFLNIAGDENVTAELPGDFIRKLELAFASILNMATPALTSPRTNDCGTMSIAGKMQEAYRYFPHRHDFLWAASGRTEGTEPHSEPTSSRFLDWAGFVVMRSGWDKDALYCVFDVGPTGEAHVHQDKLNINIYKGEDELICDDGGGQYELTAYRTYGVSAADHNTILVDGLLQRRTGPCISKSPIDAHWISNDVFDYAKSCYDGEFGVLPLTKEEAEKPLSRPAKHVRELRFYKPDFFCVYDTLSSLDGKSHTYEMRLHLETQNMERVPEIPGAWMSDYGLNYDILIVPLYPDELVSECLCGVGTPPMAGWYVARGDKQLHKSSTLTMTIAGVNDCRFGTLLFPIRRGESLPEIRKTGTDVFRVCWHGGDYTVELSNLAK